MHQCSGGQRQRIAIARALIIRPDLIILDEAVSALDVSIRAQILDLLKDLQKETGMALILITHDLGVVARMADDVAVMYAGQVVESGSVDDVFYRSSHPYTLGLKLAMPNNDPGRHDTLQPIEGSPPDLFSPPVGCAYAARCPHSMKVCEANSPEQFDVAPRHYSRCWLHHAQSPHRAVGLFLGGGNE